MKTRYFLDGIEINEPINYPELELEINYDHEINTQAVSITDFQFGVSDGRNSNDAKLIIEDKFNNGLLTEGIPFRIELDNEKGTTYTLFDGYVNPWSAKYELGQITAKATENIRIDWINDVADSVTFEYLYSINKITNADFIAVPYVISRKQNAIENIIAITTIFTISLELKRVAKDLEDAIADIAGTFNTVAGVIKFVLLIGYLTILVISIIRLIIDLYNHLVQPVKYHYAMKASRLCEIACDHLGVNFSSSILQNSAFKDMLILPEKYNIKEDNVGVLKTITGYFQPNQNEQLGFYKGTFGDLLRNLKTMFKAKVIIDNGTLYFEKYNYRLGGPLYQIPELEYNGFELNYDDFRSNYYLRFAIDYEDRNTVQEYEGTSVQIITLPSAVTNNKLLLTKNIDEITIPFALGKRKTKLNFVEQLISDSINGFINTLTVIENGLNAVISQLNKIINQINKLKQFLATLGINTGINVPSIPNATFNQITNPIENRIGMLKMESDYVNIPKVILVKDNGNKRNNILLSTNESLLNAKYLFENYHYFVSFVPKVGFDKGNQYLIKEFSNVPFTFEDYEKVRMNAYCYDYDASEAEILNLKYNPDAQTANIRYKVNKLYISNLTEKVLYPNGQ